MKRVYHIVFKEKATDHMSKGKNFIAAHSVLAISNFFLDYPAAIFIAMYDLNALVDIKGGAMIVVAQNIDNNING